MKLFKAVILSLIAIVATSCGDSGPYSDKIALYDIVTFDGQTDQGAKFSFQQVDDSPVIELLAPGVVFDEQKVRKNQRLLIGYYPASGKAYESGEIDFFGYSQVYHNEAVISTDKQIVGWDKTPVYLNSMWRSGNFLNMNLLIDHSNQTRRMELLVDQSTLNDPMPHIYFAHDLLGSPENYGVQMYATFDLSRVWNLETCEGVIVHINDSNFQKETYQFVKTH